MEERKDGGTGKTGSYVNARKNSNGRLGVWPGGEKEVACIRQTAKSHTDGERVQGRQEGCCSFRERGKLSTKWPERKKNPKQEEYRSAKKVGM